MTDNKTAKAAQELNKYSASDANKMNQKQASHPPAKTPGEAKEDDMGESSKK